MLYWHFRKNIYFFVNWLQTEWKKKKEANSIVHWIITIFFLVSDSDWFRFVFFFCHSKSGCLASVVRLESIILIFVCWMFRLFFPFHSLFLFYFVFFFGWKYIFYFILFIFLYSAYVDFGFLIQLFRSLAAVFRRDTCSHEI